ncbi:MAG: LysM peptidoglycan-binding domain-containing protein [Vampirovibrionales bacterium]|nr:LysM peptidoglycan-binding domain-containing protein [Vampirovibrionales bacterium]
MPQTPMHPRSSYSSYAQSSPDEYHSPGVYVRSRSHQAGHSATSGAPDLDMLWAGNRGFGRDERSSLLVFLGGCLVGGFVTAVGFMLFINKPQMSPEEAVALSPMAAQTETSADKPAVSTVSEAKPNLPSTAGETPALKAAQPSPEGTLRGQTYVIQSGDTLQTIAQKFYGSADDVYVLKIQKANHLESPHMIMIDQALVIPPA